MDCTYCKFAGIVLSACLFLERLTFAHGSAFPPAPHFGLCGIRREESHGHRGQMCSCPGGGWERGGWEFGVVRCKLLNRGWINNQVLLYSTGNDIQYPGINHTGKDSLYSGPPLSINCLGCPRKFIFREENVHVSLESNSSLPATL